MTKSIKLSICIPTYNRSSFLARCLSRFLQQISENGLGDEVEIVISDNGSVDDTQEVVTSLQNSFKNITYNRNETNLGIDRNVESTLNLARGEYLWFFSDDDLISDGAVKKIYPYLQAGVFGAMIVNWLDYQGDTPSGVGLAFQEDRAFSSLSDFLCCVPSTFFISSLIFKRTLVDSDGLLCYFEPPGFFHWGVFLNAASRASLCAVIAEPIICHRAGEESYLDRWPEIFLNNMPSYLIDRAADLSIASRAVRCQLKAYLNMQSFITILLVRCVNNRTLTELWGVLNKSFQIFNTYSSYYLYIIPAFFIPIPAIRVLRKYYRMFRNKPPL